jgi:hypothetical protein
MKLFQHILEPNGDCNAVHLIKQVDPNSRQSGIAAIAAPTAVTLYTECRCALLCNICPYRAKVPNNMLTVLSFRHNTDSWL